MISRNKNESKKGIELSGGKCIVCEWRGVNYKHERLIVGAHVRPFESGTEFDKRDNIIPLCPNHHAEYDGYAFTIDAKSKIINYLDHDNPYDGISVAEKIKHINEKYLAYNQYLFNRANNIE